MAILFTVSNFCIGEKGTRGDFFDIFPDFVIKKTEKYCKQNSLVCAASLATLVLLAYKGILKKRNQPKMVHFVAFQKLSSSGNWLLDF